MAGWHFFISLIQSIECSSEPYLRGIMTHIDGASHSCLHLHLNKNIVSLCSTHQGTVLSRTQTCLFSPLDGMLLV